MEGNNFIDTLLDFFHIIRLVLFYRTLNSDNRRPDKLHISLLNFEDPRFEESKYVLTSPRSLEACARLNFKPVELLRKPLRDFQEELLPKGIPTCTIFDLYDEHEKERISMLFAV